MRRFLLVLAWLLLPVPVLSAPVITYTLGMSRPVSHLFEVEVRVQGLSSADSILDFVLPVWRTGRYVIFDFAGGVERFSAQNEKGVSLAWNKTDKTTWHVRSNGGAAVTVRYLLYANEFAMRTRGLNEEHAFVDGAAVFMYVQQYRNLPLTLLVRPYADWHVTTGLDSAAGQHCTFTAPGYDYLADCPMEIGTQRDYPFTVRGIPHVFSIMGRTNCIPDSLVATTRRIVELMADYWGGLPYERYVFLLRAMPESGGGTEHINSCVLDIGATFLRSPDPCADLRGLIAHEFFHTWNVKRLRPRGMDPYDWTKENYYRELWLAEGGTSYMDNLLLVRAGMTPVQAYISQLPSQVEFDRARPGDTVQSVTACSFDAWIKYNRDLPQSFNFETDLYGGGAQVSMLLDLELRYRSDGRASFDDLLRLMWKRFPPGSGGYTVEDLERAAVELGGDSLHGFFRDYVYGAQPLRWEEELGYAGLKLTARRDPTKSWAGVSVSDAGGRAIVRTVVAGSPAAAAGLDPGDEVLALDGERVRATDFAQRLAERSPGATIRFTVFRRDVLHDLVVRMDMRAPSYAIEKVDHPTALQKALYQGWLGHAWGD